MSPLHPASPSSPFYAPHDTGVGVDERFVKLFAIVLLGSFVVLGACMLYEWWRNKRWWRTFQDIHK